MKTTIIIILYKSDFQDSVTLTSINQFPCSNETILSIWNNGPDSLKESFKQNPLLKELESKGYQIIFNEDLSNTPLSIAYNRLINEGLNSDRFIIFDQDTQVTESYMSAIQNLTNEVDLILPHLENIHTGQLVEPTDKGKVVKSDGKMALDKPGTANSGLAISHRLILLVKKYYKNTVFDENFAFYGIDGTFFIRIRRIAKKENIYAVCQGYLKHSFSSGLDEDENMKSFRSAEYTYERTLILRHYPSWGKIKTFIREIKKIIKGNSPLTCKDVFRCLWTGKHPRCYEKNKF